MYRDIVKRTLGGIDDEAALRADMNEIRENLSQSSKTVVEVLKTLIAQRDEVIQFQRQMLDEKQRQIDRLRKKGPDWAALAARLERTMEP